MFFLFIFFFFAVVIISHYVNEYKLKAIKTGEAELSPTQKSILPFCAKCRTGTIYVFAALLITGTLMLIERATGSNILSLTEKQWMQLHMSFVIVFVAMFAFLTYVHWSWFRKSVGQKLRVAK